MKKLTQKDKVLKILREVGEVNNLDCIQGRHGFTSLRLGAIIHALQKEELIEVDTEKSGFIEGTKNWRYVVKPIKPKDIVSYFVDGKMIEQRKLY